MSLKDAYEEVVRADRLMDDDSRNSLEHHEKVLKELQRLGSNPNPKQVASLTPRGEHKCPAQFCKPPQMVF